MATTTTRFVTIEIKDVHLDGFPEGSCYFWADDEGLLIGWPLIADPGEYDSDSFVTKEEAVQEPDEVVWEASGRGEFGPVRFWVPVKSLESAMRPPAEAS